MLRGMLKAYCRYYKADDLHALQDARGPHRERPLHRRGWDSSAQQHFLVLAHHLDNALKLGPPNWIFRLGEDALKVGDHLGRFVDRGARRACLGLVDPEWLPREPSGAEWLLA